MPISLALVTFNYGSQLRELSISAFTFVIDILVFSIYLVGRRLTLKAVGYELELGLVVCT